MSMFLLGVWCSILIALYITALYFGNTVPIVVVTFFVVFTALGIGEEIGRSGGGRK